MKITYFKKMAAKKRLKAQKKTIYWRNKQERLAKWHRKFVWFPLIMTSTDDDHNTMVVFEWIMQKARIRDIKYNSIRKIIWTRYTENEYFKKKLDNTLDPEQTFRTDSDTMMDTSFPDQVQLAGHHKKPMFLPPQGNI